jgi:hypothetical protein
MDSVGTSTPHRIQPITRELTMTQENSAILVVPEYVCGIPGVAHGGFVAGWLAGRTGADHVRVDFRRAVPVGTPVKAAATAESGLELTGEQGTLAVARSSKPELELPEVPSWAEATACTERRWADERAGNKGPDCYVCGVDRPAGRGMRIALGLMADRPLVAATWVPGRDLAGSDGQLPRELAFAAVDCPGGWACRAFAGAPLVETVTASLTGAVLKPIFADERYVVLGWSISVRGRKYLTGSAVATPDGEVCALAEALWLDIRKPAVEEAVPK